MTTHNALLTAVVLQRKAVVYVRQSTPRQVQLNLESQRRQYELVEVAHRRGFTNIEVIDDDLGRTASGAVERSTRKIADRRTGTGGGRESGDSAMLHWPVHRVGALID
jgi:hypothetical protein